MKKKPLVSIIIPVYNEEKYLDICLFSLTHQTYTNTEIIVVDDGSTDASREIAKHYDIRFLTIPHQGPQVARNKGAEKAFGEILVFADADIRYDKEYIKQLIKPIIEKNVSATFSKEEYVANSNNIWSQCWSVNENLPIDRRVPPKSSNYQNVVRAIKRKLFLKVNGFDESPSYFADTSICKKLNILAENTPKAISYHYNPSSLDEVFYSARWIGRAGVFLPTITNFFRFSPINSFRVSVKYLQRGAPLGIILFKPIYDFGMLCGIFFKTGFAK